MNVEQFNAVIDAMIATEHECRVTGMKVSRDVATDDGTVSVSHHVVNRKCYDFEPTYTVGFKLNGQRITRAAIYKLRVK